MPKFHITATGDVRPCNATKRPCKYGDSEHFTDRVQARGEAEQRMENEHHGSFGAAGKSTKSSLLDPTTVAHMLANESAVGESEASEPDAAVALRAKNISRLFKQYNSVRSIFTDRSFQARLYSSFLTLSFSRADSPDDRHNVFVDFAAHEITYEVDPEAFPEDYAAKYTLPYRTVKFDPTLSDTALVSKAFTTMHDALNDGVVWDHDVAALRRSYLTNGHNEINTALRAGELDAETERALDAMISGDELEEETVVYRGVRDFDGSIAKGLETQTYSDDAFMSTSTNLRTALNFSGNNPGSVVMEFTLPRGQRCLHVGGSENEIVLPRNFDTSKARYMVLDRKY